MIADAAARGSIRAYALATAQRGLCRLRAGRLRAAEADARAALEVLDGRSVVQTAVASAALAGALTELGELDARGRRAAPPSHRTGGGPETHVGPVVEDVRGRLHAAAGRWEEVLVATEACAAWERHFEVRHGGWPAWRGLAAEAHAELGHAAEARRLGAEGVDARPRRTASRARSGSRCAARPAPKRIPSAGSCCCWRRPTSCRPGRCGPRRHARRPRSATRSRPPARPTTRGRRTRPRWRRRRRSARGPSSSARATAWCASAPAHAGARACGAQALTAGERRVAELAAQGVPNREIAELLFLTLKTVENHLTATYRKLGISSRAQLADRLG